MPVATAARMLGRRRRRHPHDHIRMIQRGFYRIAHLADLSLRALIGGSLAAFMTATVAGTLIG